MGGELSEAKSEIANVMSAISAALPNVEFGVSRVEDAPGWMPPEQNIESEEAYAANPEKYGNSRNLSHPARLRRARPSRAS